MELGSKEAERVATALTCYDYRLSSSRVGLDRSSLSKKLLNLGKPLAHIANEAYFGFYRYVVAVSLKESSIEWSRVASASSFSELKAVLSPPLSDLLTSVRILLGRTLHLEWVYTSSNRSIVEVLAYEWASRIGEVVYSILAREIPVMNCAGRVGLEQNIVDANYTMYLRLLLYPFKSRRIELGDVIVASVLELEPAISLRRIRRTFYTLPLPIREPIAARRSNKRPYLFSRYKRLSSLGVIGRIWAPRLLWGNVYQRFLAVVDRECSGQLYSLVSSLIASPRVLLGDSDYSISQLYLPLSVRDKLLYRLADCVEHFFAEHSSFERYRPFHLVRPVDRLREALGGQSYWDYLRFVLELSRRRKRRKH